MRNQPALTLKVRVLRLQFQALRALAPGLAQRWAERIFSTPRRHEAPEVERAILPSSHAFGFQSQGLRLQARCWGEGPAVALLHGWEGRGTQFHAFIQPLLAAGFSALTFDQPAHGRSQGRQAGPLAFASALQALVAEVGPIHGIVAHSLGAASAAIALDRGLQVPRLVFIAPPSEPDPYFSGLLSMLGVPDVEHPAAMDLLAARQGVTMEQIRLRSLAPHLGAPLLVIHDREDRETPYSGAETVVAAWPGARLLSTEGLGHRRILKDPKVVQETVAFLREEEISNTTPYLGCGSRSLEWNLFHRHLRFA